VTDMTRLLEAGAGVLANHLACAYLRNNIGFMHNTVI
jgi:hypothetical protein